MENIIKESLDKRKKDNLYREVNSVKSLPGGRIVIAGKEYIDFSSNDYLSFSKELTKTSGVNIESSGTCASRLMTGSTDLHCRLEDKTAVFKEKEAVLVFNSGYQANVGVISSLLDSDDAVFSDKLNHASILDGIRLSQAALYRFKHNDINHLESLLEKNRQKHKKCLIITETVFSMDGDIAPLTGLTGLRDKYDSMLMVDEAHATGVFGVRGSGIVENMKLAEKVDIIMGTYSKALAGFGAYVACSSLFKQYLINFCRSFIYSTSLPEYIMEINLAALKKVQEEPHRRNKLLQNAEYLRNKLVENGIETNGESQIVPIIIGDAAETINVASKLKKKGYWVTAIRPPTVPHGKSRIRLSLTYNHGKEMLDQFVSDLRKITLD